MSLLSCRSNSMLISCKNAALVTEYFQCICHFILTTSRTPLDSKKKFTKKQLQGFATSCLRQFGNGDVLERGCIRLAGTKKYSKIKSAKAAKRFSRDCFSKWPFCRKHWVSHIVIVSGRRNWIDGKVKIKDRNFYAVCMIRLQPVPIFTFNPLPHQTHLEHLSLWLKVVQLQELLLKSGEVRFPRGLEISCLTERRPTHCF